MLNCNNKFIFETTRGDNFTLHISLTDLPFAGASKLTSTIRREEDASQKVSASTSVSGKGNYKVHFSPSQTKDLDGTYAIDLELSDGTTSGNRKTLILGSLIVHKDVTY
jgi:hypothetical protein|uniref:Uncharacterized protein n=1 Tax=Siphoviridae sp. ctZUr4 TaxID=2827892 RepID=A0A8S5SUS5_9CAUD|nr:MAG TPA: hypothetical protein [Siphoviridae sp. ctZUr4]